MIRHEEYMKIALEEAQKAYDLEEVPIGCVIVYEEKIIGKAYNLRNTKKKTLAHAELLAINQASEYIGDWRLEECNMYITLEPCPMCAGAIVQARIPTVIIGAKNYKSGSAGTVVNLLQQDGFNHQVEVINNVLEKECSSMLKDFFKKLRKK